MADADQSTMDPSEGRDAPVRAKGPGASVEAKEPGASVEARGTARGTARATADAPRSPSAPKQSRRGGDAPPAPSEPSGPSRTSSPSTDGISRRRLLGTAGATGLTFGAVGGAAGYAAASSSSAEKATPLSSLGAGQVPFHVKHQPGITTPLQARGHLIAFDLAAGAGRREAAALMRRWSETARRLMAGETSAQDDTGIALDAGPSSLTVTFGFGHSFFARTGLEKQRPDSLDPLPDFSSDQLDKARSNGDLWVQIGADDALVAFHALRAIQKDAGGAARVRWQMNGFNRSPGATSHPMTARNLMGQIDGTRNPKPTEPDFDERIFVPASAGGSGEGASDDPAWMANGSYAVVRRIRMLLDDWDEFSLKEQEDVIGRRKSDGAALSGGAKATETTEMDLEKTDAQGNLLVPINAHARITRPDQNGGAAILRRPFSFHDGIDAKGVPDAGLLFICWQADPLRGFIPLQRKLDRGDALSTFIRHESSGLFAVPGGAAKGEYVGQRLLEG
ncbi:iron uptake transporter deferrochelatase/peroxidase subunit [Streptomyces ipomoeae]|uniref:iron uptake transporter deferrochelatase/peroxidase subunit n=1 Tax=Streptomyces ipomoeae TaxID=103232 RepID=UPI0029B341B2|nr:iron uptake transporter deferrochelatase/peroxidase subunit [Streptomyces ipomoeae]MDX2819884.1 iron uptake transporter deferrochelatase/peroxidase subunit [Streptomyces ipomoeae]MDX2872288.1 iron uptake transporter deferrochelatase/peroxidase subunit [Streptomyces ipomoeae]